MRHFEVREHAASTGSAGAIYRALGRRALGAGVLIVQEGAGWVTTQDGGRQALAAKSVVIWDTGEWVEYGSDDGLIVEEYWAVREPDGAAESRLAAFFGDEPA
jgi:hypothetical protein